MNSVGAADMAEQSIDRVAELEAKLATIEAQLRLERERYRELRHRIRNDLQGLATLISAQASKAGRPQDCSRCAMRLRSTAELHVALDDDEASDISMAFYLWALAEARRKAFDDQIVGDTIADEDIFLDHRRAQCVGLVYVEAITNAMKHAFPGGVEGHIETRLRRSGDLLELTVADDGIGFDPECASRGAGIDLMRGLARQLKGELQLLRLAKGAMMRLTFPAARD